jgi:hypothetical protein
MNLDDDQREVIKRHCDQTRAIRVSREAILEAMLKYDGDPLEQSEILLKLVETTEILHRLERVAFGITREHIVLGVGGG